MQIRPATKTDASAIVQIQVQAWRAAYAGLIPQDFLDRMDSERRLAGWRRVLSEPGGMATDVALGHGDEVIGFCVHGPSRDADAHAGVGELVAINLLPMHWRHGLGSMMMARLLAVAAERRWQALTLWVLEANAPARRFYQAQGFEADGARRVDMQLTGTPLHLVRYRRLLGPSPESETG